MEKQKYKANNSWHHLPPFYFYFKKKKHMLKVVVKPNIAYAYYAVPFFKHDI